MGAQHGIRALVTERRVEIHFMPIVRLAVSHGTARWRTHAFEALVRGPESHPLRSPCALFQAAEAAGLREELDLLCVGAALAHRDKLPESAHLFLNVHPQTFQSAALFALLEERGPGDASAPRTVVEITEQEVPHGPQFRERVLALQAMGFDVALDDIGVDPFSFGRLIHAGPVAYWKLDRSVLLQWAARADVVQSWLPWVGKVAQGMGTQLVLEGLEDRHLPLLPELHALGVGLGQGFIFGKPAILSPDQGAWRRGFQQMIPAVQVSRAEPALIPLRGREGLSEFLGFPLPTL